MAIDRIEKKVLLHKLNIIWECLEKQQNDNKYIVSICSLAFVKSIFPSASVFMPWTLFKKSSFILYHQLHLS